MIPSPVFFCEFIYVKTFFIPSFHAGMRSHMFYKIDFLKIHRKTPVPDSLDSGTDVFLRIFKNY